MVLPSVSPVEKSTLGLVTSGKTGRPENISFSLTGTGRSGWNKRTFPYTVPSTRSPSLAPRLSCKVKAHVLERGLLS